MADAGDIENKLSEVKVLFIRSMDSEMSDNQEHAEMEDRLFFSAYQAFPGASQLAGPGNRYM